MALTGLFLASLTTVFLTNAVSVIPSLESKKRVDVVDEAFLDQKDVLLDMLESKLRAVQKKKKKSDRSEAFPNLESGKCEALLSNVDLKMKANGLSAVGDAEVVMKFGESGKATLNLDASGISNVGKTRLELGVGNGGILIPGLSNLLIGTNFLKNCELQKELVETSTKGKQTHNFGSELLTESRRSGGGNATNLTISSSPNDLEVNTVKAKLGDNQTAGADTTTSSPNTDTTVLEVNTGLANTTLSPVTLPTEAGSTTVVVATNITEQAS